MIDWLLYVIHFCASCVSDNNVIPPAAGALGGAAGAAGGLGGLGSLSGGSSSDASGTGADANSGNGNGSGNGSRSASGNRSGPSGSTSNASSRPGSDTASAPDQPTPDSNTAAPTGTDAPDTGGGPTTHVNNPFADESGGIAEHPATGTPENKSDPFASPQSTPDPLFSDGPQVDGSPSPGDDSSETDYINPNGTPMGSSPAAPQTSGVATHTGSSTHGLPRKANKP